MASLGWRVGRGGAVAARRPNRRCCAAAGHGLINADDVAPIIRSVPLIGRVGSVTVPALSIEMLRTAQRAQALRVEYGGDDRARLRVGEIDVPLEPDGSFWVHFSPRYADRVVSAEDVLSGKAAALLKDNQPVQSADPKAMARDMVVPAEAGTQVR